jgi:tRNA-Thr(GGU) m(6)t(6)A37 methyltransferase TsaA
VFEPIGTVRSPWPEKFGVPRQAGLAPAVTATIELDPARVPAEALRGLEATSHVWIVFVFHRSPPLEGATVRPPRLGGNQRLGVLATRSPVRPNPIGISAVRLLGIEGHRLRVAGPDLVDGTPVLDIKPYVPYADAIPEATCAWADRAPTPLPVCFSEDASATLASRPDADTLRDLIEQSLRWDPRPAYHDDDPDRVYAARLDDVDVRWRVEGGGVVVVEIVGA